MNVPCALDIAREIRSRGWWPVPVRGKVPLLTQWQERRVDPDAEPSLFQGCTGAGVVLGVSGLKDLEADCPAAEYVLQELAPATDCVWERAGRRHRLYRCPEHGGTRWEIVAPAGAEKKQLTLVELRGGREQSVFPGSRHPSGGVYQWVTSGSPAELPYADLHRAARLAAAAGALALYWPGEGTRHQVALAAAGYLRRAGLTPREAEVAVRAAVLAAGDPEVEDRLEAVRTTYDRGAEEAFTGLPKLGELCGKPLADWLQRHLPTDRSQTQLGMAPPGVGASVEGAPSPADTELRIAELLQAAAAAEGAQRTEQLRQLAQAIPEDPLQENAVAERVRQLGLAPKQAFLKSVAAARKDLRSRPAAPGLQLSEATEREGIYSVQHGALHYDRPAPGGGSVATPLCNFSARIAREEIRDDGAERSTFFTLEGALASGEPLPPALVPSDRYGGMGWVTAHWGTRAVVYAGQSLKDHLRVAVQMLSRDVPRRTVYGHLGWRQIGGEWLYLHAGGAIGPKGPVFQVEVSLGDGKLGAYRLPPPPEGEELREAIRASLDFLELCRPDLTYALLSAVYRAPLAEALPLDLSVFLAGGTGAQKSELTAMAQAHYGADFHAKALPGNWSTTSNTLEKQAFLVKDALFTVDDFAPCGNTADVQRFHREADRLFRAQGNRSGRGRMRPDGSLRPEYFPRGLVLSSGEDLPNGHSVRARLLILEVSRGEVDLERLTRIQAQAREGRLAQAMAGYLRWLAPQMGALASELRGRHEALRTAARAGGTSHDRTPDNLASLYLGLEMLLRYAQESGALTPAEAEQHRERGWRALWGVSREQGAHQATEEPTERFLSLLGAVFSSGHGYLGATEADGPPEDAELWGWRAVEVGTGEFHRREWRPTGSCLGWVTGDHVLLEPESVFAAVQRLAREQGTSFPLSARTLWKRLAEKGLLLSREPSQGRNLVRWMIAGTRKRVLPLHRASLYPENGPNGPTGPGQAEDSPPARLETVPSGFSPPINGPAAPGVEANGPAGNGPNGTGNGPVRGRAPEQSRHASPALGPLGPFGPVLERGEAPPAPAQALVMAAGEREVFEL